MNTQEQDEQFEKSVEMAARLISTHGADYFYTAVTEAARSYGQDWHEIQAALSARSAGARQDRASSSPVKRIKDLCKAWRKEQREKKRPEPPGPQGALF